MWVERCEGQQFSRMNERTFLVELKDSSNRSWSLLPGHSKSVRVERNNNLKKGLSTWAFLAVSHMVSGWQNIDCRQNSLLSSHCPFPSPVAIRLVKQKSVAFVKIHRHTWVLQASRDVVCRDNHRPDLIISSSQEIGHVHWHLIDLGRVVHCSLVSTKSSHSSVNSTHTRYL